MIIREDVRQMNILGFKNVPASGSDKSRSKQSSDKCKMPKGCSKGHGFEDDVTSHKVPCGLCGKEVALGRRQKELIATNWKQRQDSSSTTSH